MTTADIQLHDIPQSPSKKEEEFTTTTIETPDSYASYSRDSLSQDLERSSEYSNPSPKYQPNIIQPFVIDRNFRITLFAVWIGNFLCGLDATIVSTTMSNIASDFGQSNLVSWIAVSYLLTSTAFQPLYGKTSDILGRKTLLFFAQSLFGLGILLSGIATNVQTLSIARAISGIGGAGMFALTTIIISDVVPLAHRSMYTAYGIVVVSVSQMLGGPVGGFCIVTIGWRMMFILQVPLVLICIVLTVFCDLKVEHIPEGPDRYSQDNLKRIDFGGIITLNFFVSSLIFLLSDDGGFSKLFKSFLFFILISSIISYIYVERYIAIEKLIEPDIIVGQIGALGIINGVNSLSFYMIIFVTPIYLQLIQNIDVTEVGLYTMFGVVASGVGAVLAGRLINRSNHTESSTMTAGVLVSLSFFFLQTSGFSIIYLTTRYVTPGSTSVLWKFCFFFGLTIAGMGAGGFGPGVSLFVIGKAGRIKQASAQTVVSLVKSLGNVIGVSVSLSIYTKHLSQSLTKYFGEDGHPFLEKLIKDSSFLHNGLDSKYVQDVSLIYRNSLSMAFYPIFFLTFVALIVMVLFYRSVRRALEVS